MHLELEDDLSSSDEEQEEKSKDGPGPISPAVPTSDPDDGLMPGCDNDWEEENDEDNEDTHDQKADVAVLTGGVSPSTAPGTGAAMHHNLAPTLLLNESQRECIQLAKSGVSFFITGGAGTGKSAALMHVVDALRQHYQAAAKQMMPCPPVVVTATTNQAALVIHGCTIHSWAGLRGSGAESLSDAAIQALCKRKWFRERIEAAKTLIIDEISMMHPRSMDAVDRICRACRGAENATKIFGGLQVIVVGDFAQLPPVDKDRRAGESPSYAFDWNLWPVAFPTTVLLTQTYRQQDQAFVTLLNELRLGVEPREEHKQWLRNRVYARFADPSLQPTMLHARNSDVDKCNQIALSRQPGKVESFPCVVTMRVSRDALYKLNQLAQDAGVNKSAARHLQLLENRINKNQPTQAAQDFFLKHFFDRSQSQDPDPTLHLKVGAQVILTANLAPLHGLVNGSRGYVVGFVDKPPPCNYPIVRFLTGVARSLIVRPFGFTRAYNQYWDAVLVQVPLRLGYAITVHKSQSVSLDCAMISLDHFFRSPGQAYTALSRVRSLDSLTLTNLDWMAFQADPKVVEFYRHLHQSSRQHPQARPQLAGPSATAATHSPTCAQPVESTKSKKNQMSSSP